MAVRWVKAVTVRWCRTRRDGRKTRQLECFDRMIREHEAQLTRMVHTQVRMDETQSVLCTITCHLDDASRPRDRPLLCRHTEAAADRLLNVYAQPAIPAGTH